MSSQEMFVRDPREGSFLNEQFQKVLALAEHSAHGIPVSEEDDFCFMTMQFLYKQMQHAESVLQLAPRRDAGLIAHTMIDGLYQLMWASRAPDERGRLRRSFAIIEDWRLMQGRIREGLTVDEADIRRNKAGLEEFGDLHRTENPKPNVQDAYHRYGAAESGLPTWPTWSGANSTTLTKSYQTGSIGA